MSHQKPDRSRRPLVLGLLLLSSWGFFGLGVLNEPIPYFLGIVLPLGYLLGERSDAAARRWNSVWIQLASGAAVCLGVAVYATLSWLLF